MNRPRFLGSVASRWILASAILVVALWLGGVAMLLIEVMQAITGAGTKGCS